MSKTTDAIIEMEEMGLEPTNKNLPKLFEYRMQTFASKYHNEILAGKNDNKKWTAEDLELLDLCTRDGEGIRLMTQHFERKGKSIKAMQRKRAYDRLAFLQKMERETRIMEDEKSLKYVQDEILLLKKFLNV